MNTRYYFLIVLWAMSLFAPLHAQTYDKMWKEVEQLQKKDLPQSVVSASMKIYDKAKAERDVPQMMKAYLTAMQYRTLVIPDSLEGIGKLGKANGKSGRQGGALFHFG